MHRHFFIKISHNLEYIQTFVMIEELHFTLLVVDGIYIIILNFDKYNYTYSYTFSNTFPLNSIFQDLSNDI